MDTRPWHSDSQKNFDGSGSRPATWRNNTQISCLASGHSRFLSNDATGRDDRNEIIVLNADGSFHSHLSKDWPDEIMP